MGLVSAVLAAALLAAAAAQCPEFDDKHVPECYQKTDHELCILGAHKDSDRISDFEFMGTPKEYLESDPLACKMRTAAIRQHVLYHGEHGHGSTNCKRAAAIFKTNILTNARISDVCDQIGFLKCGTCRHGGKVIVHDDGSCSCKCSGGWTGKTCSECAMTAVECLHQGNLTATRNLCECACEYPWSGVHCEQCNRRCAHGGFSDPTDARCNCQCSFPWAGRECESCSLKCQHSGRLVTGNDKCECDCPPLATGPQCEQCTARCLNGGVLDKKTCTCKCIGGFTGHQCETCDVECQHNATFVPNECRCKCNNPFTSGKECEVCSNNCNERGRSVGCQCVECDGYWAGETCNNCTLNCVNEGELSERTCKCACDKTRCKHGQFKDNCACACDGFWRGETCDKCQLTCRHGTLNKNNCTCECEGNFSGPKCDRCEHNCTGRGLLDANECICKDCIAPYYGYDCQQKCTKNCQHGSVLDTDACECNQCVLPWLGAECDTCKLTVNLTVGQPVCKHGQYDSENCQCVCDEGWSGERCSVCSRSCAHGTLNRTTCSCSCEQHWAGSNCTECAIECENGGTVDEKNCYCECDRMHSGTYCQGGPCFMQQSCDACLSVSDGCEWCAKTGSCAKKPGPGAETACIGPFKRGMCPTYGDCNMCDYTPAELHWLSSHGDDSVGWSQGDSLMPEADGPPEPHEMASMAGCDRSKGETWCEERQLCVQDWEGGVNGPCHKPTPPAHVHALNGFISTDVQ